LDELLDEARAGLRSSFFPLGNELRQNKCAVATNELRTPGALVLFWRQS